MMATTVGSSAASTQDETDIVEADEGAPPLSNISVDSKEVERLRQRVQEEPRSALLNAKLAVALASSKTDEQDKEARVHAQLAMELAPGRPAGYAAYSLCAVNHEERMQALRKAVELWTPVCSMTKTSYAGLLARMLMDPRTHDAETETRIGKSSPLHPNRRSLNQDEKKLYNSLQEALLDAKEDSKKGEQDILTLAKMEYRLGLFFRKMNPVDRYRPFSHEHFSNAIELFPADSDMASTAAFWLASVSPDEDEKRLLDRCPKEYVVSLYSTFASNFDQLLVEKLRYETPTKLRRLLDETVGNDARMNICSAWANCTADLGCGTGLSGVAFRSCTRQMVGVDLSPEMIEKAKERNCYDELSIGDLSSILSSSTKEEGNRCQYHRHYDLIVSCDVFCYIGKLNEIFSEVRDSLTEGGLFCFSTELLSEDYKFDFVLQSTCARFAHKKSYIETMAQVAGMETMKLQVCPIRKNAGQDVMGILAVLRKGSEDGFP